MAIDQATIEAAARQYYKEIYRYCELRLADKNDVEDVVQNVFLTMQEKSGELKPEHLRAWLYSVAQKKILEEGRDTARRSRIVTYDEEAAAKDPTLVSDSLEPDNIPDGDLEAAKTHIIHMLSPREQRLFETIYENHVARKEAAEQFGITENALNVRVHRLKKHIKGLMQTIILIILLIAALCVSMLPTGTNDESLIHRWGYSLFRQGDGARVEFGDRLTIGIDGDVKIYTSIRQFVRKTGADVLVPTALPAGCEIRRVLVSYSHAEACISVRYTTNDPAHIGMRISMGRETQALESWESVEQIGGFVCGFSTTPDWCQCNFNYNGDGYSITAKSYADLRLILENMKESSEQLTMDS